MVLGGRYKELCETITTELLSEHDKEFRLMLMKHLVHFLRYAGDGEASLSWAKRICEEDATSPFAWTGLANWHLHANCPDVATRDDLMNALRYCEIALEKAHSADQFVWYVLFDTCRVLTDLEDYPRIENTMKEILCDLEFVREHHSPRIEGEWLYRVPEGKLQLELVLRFKELEAIDRERMRRHRYETRPATLAELER